MYKSLGLLFVSFGMFFYAPQNFNISFVLFCMVLFILQSSIVVHNSIRHRHIFCFTNIFVMILFFVTYLIPIFVIFNLETIKSFVFYADEYGSICSAYVNIALSAYSIGYLSSCKMKRKTRRINISKTQNRIAKIFSVFITIIFIAYILITEIETNDIDGYIGSLILPIYSVSLLLNTIYHRNKIGDSLRKFLSFNIDILLLYSCIIISLLIIGDRTLPLSLILVIIGIYNFYVKKIDTKYIASILVCGFIVFNLIGFSRNNTNAIQKLGFVGFFEFSKNVIANPDVGYVYYLQDVIPINLDLYLAEKWIAENDGDYFLPGRVLFILASPIPYIPALLSNIVFDRDPREMSSAYCLTDYNKSITKTTDNSGVGTHVVSDIYISWGIIGIIICFFIFGKAIRKSEINMYTNFYYAIIYINFVSYSIYIPRATLYLNFRELVFSILILYLIRKIK